MSFVTYLNVASCNHLRISKKGRGESLNPVLKPGYLTAEIKGASIASQWVKIFPGNCWPDLLMHLNPQSLLLSMLLAIFCVEFPNFTLPPGSRGSL